MQTRLTKNQSISRVHRDNIFVAAQAVIAAIDEIVSANGSTPRKIFLINKFGPKKRQAGNDLTTALSQRYARWRKEIAQPGSGSRITKSGITSLLKFLEGPPCNTSPEKLRHIQNLWLRYWELARREDRRVNRWLPRRTISEHAAKFFREFESRAIAAKDCTDPKLLASIIDKHSGDQRRLNNFTEAMNTAIFFVYFFQLAENPLRVSEEYRRAAIAHAAWQGAWAALQKEDQPRMRQFLNEMRKVAKGSDDASVQAARWYVESSMERITHTSDTYPNANYCQLAYSALLSGRMNFGGKRPFFSSDLEDPLLHYSPANELRLRGATMDFKVGLFEGRTVAEQMWWCAEKAHHQNRSEESARILSSYARGLCNDRRLDKALEFAALAIKRLGTDRRKFKASFANAEHALGIAEYATGNVSIGEGRLQEAMHLYEQLGARNRQVDVMTDWVALRKT